MSLCLNVFISYVSVPLCLYSLCLYVSMSLYLYVSVSLCLCISMSLYLYASILYVSMSLFSMALCLCISMFLCLCISISLYLYVSVSLCLYVSVSTSLKSSDSVTTNQNFVRKRGGGRVDFQLCLSLVGNSPDVVRQSRSYLLPYLLYLHTAIIVQRNEGEKYEAVSDTM